MTRDELIAKLVADTSIGAYLDAGSDIPEAVDEAAVDCGWTLPVSTAFRTRWITHRARRHCYARLKAGNVRKFRVEQLNLNQRFENYRVLVRDMDAEFRSAIADNPEEFAGVDAYKLFGTVAGPGFEYDELGRDITYE